MGHGICGTPWPRRSQPKRGEAYLPAAAIELNVSVAFLSSTPCKTLLDPAVVVKTRTSEFFVDCTVAGTTAISFLPWVNVTFVSGPGSVQVTLYSPALIVDEPTVTDWSSLTVADFSEAANAATGR